MNNKKHYITVAEILETVEESFGLSDWSTVKEELKTMQSPINFTGKKAPTLRSDTFGMIPLLKFMEGLTDNGETFCVNDLKEFLKETENFDWYENSCDNTYNYNGFLERDINFWTFNNEQTYQTLVFVAVHVGIDPRAGYTNYSAFVFDNEYDFLEALSQTFEIACFEYLNKQGEKMFVTLDGSATSENFSLYFHESYETYDSYEFKTDVSDLLYLYDSDALEVIAEALKEKGIDFQENSLKVVE